MNWEQFRAIVWLRWRLSRNQFARGGQLNAILAIVVLVLLVSTAVGLGIGGVALGVFLGAKEVVYNSRMPEAWRRMLH